MIYVLTETEEWNGKCTDPMVVGATTSVELADRWNATSGYINGEIHEAIPYYEYDAETLVNIAEEVEKEREQKHSVREEDIDVVPTVVELEEE